MFQENAISYRFSDRIYQNSIMWLQSKSFIAKGEEDEPNGVQTQFDNEFVLVYHNVYTF